MTVTSSYILTTPSFVASKTSECTEEESVDILSKLHATLKNVNSLKITGVGLAAPQIGINKSVFVTHIPDEDGTVYARGFVNPVICELKKPVRFSGEGCLSFPGETCETLRYAECVVKSLEDSQGVHLVGLSAIVAQHETDHLLGLTMFDRKLKNIGPNEKCPCGSQKKFKKCCSLDIKDFGAIANTLSLKF